MQGEVVITAHRSGDLDFLDVPDCLFVHKVMCVYFKGWV